MRRITYTLFVFVTLLLASSSFAESIKLEWSPSTELDIKGYNIYYGAGSRNYGVPISVDNITQSQVDGLENDKTYYFAITAVDTSGNESGFSEELELTTSSGAIPPLPPVPGSQILSDDFEDANFEGWEIVDKGLNYSPSAWSVKNGVLYQASNIFGGPSNGADPFDPGTFALNGDLSWNDYSVAVKVRSQDDDGIGVMVRYQDPDNYYLFSMGKQRNYRKLTKMVNGSLTVLAEDAVPYVQNQWYDVTFEVDGNKIKVYLDGAVIFDVEDDSLATGKIGVFSWGNAGSEFDNVIVTPIVMVAFTDDFSDGDYEGWQVVDEGLYFKPSSWSVKDGVLYQASNIFGGPSTGADPFAPGTYALNGDIAWADYSVGLKIRSQDDDGLGVMVRYQNSDNYYLFSMGKQRAYRKLTKRVNGVLAVLAEDTVPYILNQWFSVKVDVIGSSIKVYVDGELIFDVTDDSLVTGKIGLYSWGNAGSEFDEIVVSPTVPPNQEIDGTDPEIMLLSPVIGTTYETLASTIDLSGTASDTVGVTQVRWSNSTGGNGTASGLENWTVSSIALAEGVNTIIVSAVDDAGNQADVSLAVTYTPLDTTPPEVTIISPVPSGFYDTDEASVSLSGTASDSEGGVSVTWENADGASGSATGTENWSVSGLPLTEGGNIITLTALDEAGNSAAKSITVNYTKVTPASFADDFSDGNYTGWSIVDEGLNFRPSSWSVKSGAFRQESNIFGGSSTEPDPFSPGTYALDGDASWTDYSTEVKVRSQDDDGIGVMVRYQDSDNYYLFSMGKQRKYRKLTKRVSGVLTVLDEDTVPYNINQWYAVKIDVQGNSIKVHIDDILIFDVTDDSLASGKIGLYSWGNAGGEFDDISVTPSAPPAQEADETVPEITLTSPVSGGTYETAAGSINLAGTASDNVGVTQIAWGNAKGGSGIAQGLQAWTIADIPLVEGSNTIVVVALDEAENEASTFLNVIYTPPDTLPPNLTITSPVTGGTYDTNQATVDISGTAADNIGVDIVSWTSSSGTGGDVTGKETWTVSGIGLSEGLNTITVTAKDRAGNTVDKAIVVTYTVVSGALIEDDFSDGDYAGWSIVDKGLNFAPSSWRVTNGAFYQGSNIFGGSSYSLDPFNPGTYALQGESSWTNYNVDLKLRSQDDDGIGVMVRYLNSDNYYLFSMGKQRNYRKLTKRVNGVLTVLAEDTVPYSMNQWYSVRIEAQGSNLKVSLDGALLFDVIDDSIPSGKIGLYSWGNAGSEFDDIFVE